ncbi:Chromatin assembly factor 1 subunit B [Nosema granulosis]|uniref:Chromatin assembly factor 1 subunit B n=1 Tax=Nosema granulosis TaxID=83296 RepID=A0A9P6KZ60_9MICR|nr:Chromatin assembly factor 1 subunit B [Nosema granulosis]
MFEVTTHNLYFHDQSSIFSLDSFQDLLCTGGGDGVARLWKIESSESSSTGSTFLEYFTALDSPIKISYLSDLHTHSRTVNCVRFSRNGDLASCSDGGKIFVTLSGKIVSVREADGKDCYELLWIDNFLVAGLSCGTIEVFKTSEQGVCKLSSLKIHSDTVQGLTYRNTSSLLVSVGKDNLLALMDFNLETGEISKISTNNLAAYNLASTNRGFYRRISFSKDGLLQLVSCKTNLLINLSHPYRELHWLSKVGPLDSDTIRVVEDKLTYIVTKKSVYVYEESNLKGCVENISFKSTTDATMCCGILFVSSLDGFISSLKLKNYA